MEDATALKVDKSSRSSIGALSDAKDEFITLITKMDKEVHDLSQQIRLTDEGSNVELVGRVNKLKLHRKKLQDQLIDMEAIQEDSWERMRPVAAMVFKEASSAMQ